MFHGDLRTVGIAVDDSQAQGAARSALQPGRRKLLIASAIACGLHPAPSLGADVANSGRTRLLWPATPQANSVRQQTAELAWALKKDDIEIVVRAGTHVVATPMIATGQRIRLLGEPGAILLFAEMAAGGIRFVNSEGSSVEDLALKWEGEGKPPRSHYGAGILFVRSNSPRVLNVLVSRAPGGGIQFDECEDALVQKCRVEWTGADGIHFANSDRSTAQDCSSFNTGDDCIAIVDYAKKRPGVGFLIENCNVGNSRARGIAVVGGSQGVIRNCEIGPTASNGLHIEQDTHYASRKPQDVRAEKLSIFGTGEVVPRAGNQFAVNILRAERIQLDDLAVDGGSSAGLSLVDSKDINVQNVRVANTKGAAARLIRSSVDMNEVSLANSGGELLVADECPRFNATALRLRPGLLAAGARPVRLRGSQKGKLEIFGIGPNAVINASPEMSLISR